MLQPVLALDANASNNALAVQMVVIMLIFTAVILFRPRGRP